MKRIAFNPKTDPAPIPFDRRILIGAFNLKRHGLPWRPHIGCFVWDCEDQIAAPSPFPLNIYFVLNLNRFTSIFGNMEKMKEALVWVPTWHQAIALCGTLGITVGPSEQTKAIPSPDFSVEAYLTLYNRIAMCLHNTACMALIEEI